jgi:hypothetical protein
LPQCLPTFLQKPKRYTIYSRYVHLKTAADCVSAGVRLKASFIGRLIWKPFDLQFADVLTRLEEHKELFRLEASLASTEESLRFYAKCEDSVRQAERQPGSDKYYANEERTSMG